MRFTAIFVLYPAASFSDYGLTGVDTAFLYSTLGKFAIQHLSEPLPITPEDPHQPYRKERTVELFTDSVIIEPKGRHTATVVLLHGLTQNSKSMIDKPWVSALGQDVKFVSVGSPPSWFNPATWNPSTFFYNFVNGEEVVDLKSLDLSARRVSALIDSEAKLVGYQNIFLVGYSQGGMLALWTGLMVAKQIGGLVAINTAVPVFRIGKVANPKLDIAHFHGTSDQVVFFPIALLSRKNAVDCGAENYRMYTNPGDHFFTDEVALKVSDWLSRKISY